MSFTTRSNARFAHFGEAVRYLVFVVFRMSERAFQA